MVHLHEVRDTDSHYVIDPITRAIENANSAKNTLMQDDHNSEIYTFEIPRYVEGHDMTLCNAIRIHFNDISADKANESRDFYPVEDMHLDEVQTDTLVFSWLVSGNATMYAGLLSFRIQFLCINDSGVVTYKWHTDIFKGITISDGFDNSEAAVEEYTDVIAKWETEIFGAGDSVIENIQNAAGEQIASIEEARSAAVSAVEAKGAETLETIPDDYTELYGMAYGAIRTRANAIVENVEGDAVAANDCSDDYLRGLRVFGKSEQIKTTGKNLFDISKEELLVVGSSGVQRYGYSFNGPGTFTFSCAGDNATSITVKVVSDGVYGDYKSYVLTAKHTATLGENDVLIIYRAEENVRLSDGISNPQLEVGTVATEYEPYTGGVASPSPEYPQEINSAENPEVGVYGKNLLKNIAASSTSNGITFTVNEDGSVTVNGTATAGAWLNVSGAFTLPKGAYILSGCPKGGAYASTYVLSATPTADYGNPKTFVLEEETNIVVNIGVYAGYTANNLTFYPMIRHASIEDATYEPYKEPQTVTIPHTLPGVPVSSGGNYTDANGQKWICDEIDLARGVYVQRVASVTFSGEEDWYVSAAQIDSGTRFDCNISTAPVALATDCLCNRFRYNGVNALVETTWILENSQGFRIITEKANTVEELKAFLAANPTVMQYAMYSPSETALTDAEIVAFKALHSNYPNTTVLNDAGAWMEVAYNADTELYFNKSRGASDEQVQKSVDAWLTANLAIAEEVSF